MNTQYRKIINSFVNKYGLNRGEVIAEIEKTFSTILSRWHGQHVVVLFGDDQLMALGYQDSNGIITQTPIELGTMRGWNTIKKELDKNLSKAACLREVANYKQKEREMRWGEICRKKPSGDLEVEIEIEQGQPVMAICRSNSIGIHERDSLKIGQRRAFHLRRVEPILLDNTARVQVTVDRVSKTLVENLLYDQLGRTGIQIKCQTRYVGHKSFVESSAFLPKKTILSVSSELNEHIQVNLINTTKDFR